MAELEESEILTFLRAIESGEIVLTPDDQPQDVYAGNVSYSASNGWKIIVFNDCNQWDYIDSITANDGRTFDYDQIEQMPELSKYVPTEEIAWKRYQIPGYLTFRCVTCGKTMKMLPPGTKDYRCESC